MAEKPRRPTTESAVPEASRLALLRMLTTCMLLLTIFASLFVLRLTRELVVPLIVAVFLMILVDGLSRQVARIAPNSPEWARLSAAFLLIIVVLVGAVYLIVRAAPGFAADLGGVDQKIENLLAGILAQFGLPPLFENGLQDFDFKPLLSPILTGIRHLATDTIFVIIYLGFLLASRRTFTTKFRRLFPDPSASGHAQRVFDRVRNGAESYIGIQTIKALMMGIISFGVMTGVGLHHAIFLAFLIFLGAYIPLLGAAAAVLAPVLLGFAQFGLAWQPILMAGLLQSLVIVLDNVILPRMQSDKLDVDPVVVLMSLAFWSLIFGVAGALLSTPLTVVVIALTAETSGMRWLAVVLSKEGDPTGELESAAQEFPAHS